MMNDLLRCLQSTSMSSSDYEDRKLSRINPKDNNGIGVSTAYTSDMGYETALLDANGVPPVERYDTKDQAAQNHDKWVKFANDPKNIEVTKLGYGELVEDETIKLERVK